VNVALSRAKELLVIVGNRHYLQSEEFFSRKEAAVFEKMISHAVVMGSGAHSNRPRLGRPPPLPSRAPRTSSSPLQESLSY